MHHLAPGGSAPPSPLLTRLLFSVQPSMRVLLPGVGVVLFLPEHSKLSFIMTPWFLLFFSVTRVLTHIPSHWHLASLCWQSSPVPARSLPSTTKPGCVLSFHLSVALSYILYHVKCFMRSLLTIKYVFVC